MTDIEHMLKNAPQVAMTQSEKALMRERLSAFMDAYPVTYGIESPYVFRSAWFSAAHYARVHFAQVLAAFLLIVAGGVTSFANTALPGDSLYAIKVKFNEQVVGALALTTEAKAQYEAELAERRLSEATMLSTQGRLTNEARVRIEADFSKHVKNVEAGADKLAASNNVRGAVEASSELESVLRAHATVLNNISDGFDETATVASTVRRELTAVSQRLNSFEKKIDNEVSIEAERTAREKSLRAEMKLDEVTANAGANKEKIGEKSYEEVMRHVNLSLAALSDGYLKMQNGTYNKAFVAFQESIQQSKEARLLLNAAIKLDMRSQEETEAPAGYGESIATTTEGETQRATTTSTSAGDGESFTTIGSTTEDAKNTPSELESGLRSVLKLDF